MYKIILPGILGALAVGTAIGVKYFFNKAIVRKTAEVAAVPIETGTNWDAYIPFIHEKKEWLDTQKIDSLELISFDGLKLSAKYLPAKEQSNKTIICSHGYQSKGLNDFAPISQLYHSLGYNVLMVDNRAHGESEGKYIGFGVLDRKDFIKWINYEDKKFDGDCIIILHGISMGGATVLMTRGQKLPKSVKGTITDCGFTSAWDIFAHLLHVQYHLPVFPMLTLTSKKCEKLAGYSFDECSSAVEINKSDIPALIIHGEEDDFVPTFMAKQIFDSCKAEKKLVIIPKAGHAESYFMDKEKVEKEIKEFIENYGKN